jgi:hypothetical protein
MIGGKQMAAIAAKPNLHKADAHKMVLRMA